MSKVILTRIVSIILTMFVVISLVFFLVRLTGDPAQVLLPPSATQEQVKALRDELGLDEPLWKQYGIYMGRIIFEGDFGDSYKYDVPAIRLVLGRAIPTLKLTFAAILFAVLIGIPTGLIAGLNLGNYTDVFTQGFALFGQSVPTFWLGIMLVLVFSVSLGWFPVMGKGSVLHLILPAITLGAPTAALISRMLRSSVQDIARKEYICTARSKGVSEQRVVFKHIFRNALIPMVTVVMFQMGYLMGGAVVTEQIFNYPGMGRLVVSAMYSRDFQVVQSFVIVVAFFVSFANFIADILYAFINPKVRYK